MRITAQTRLADHAEHVFRHVLPAKMEGYEAREPQIEMAKLVAEGLESDRNVTVEAGTGTGKSIALLVPGIEHARRKGKPVIVSTGTIALQEQYVKKDVPFLQGVLEPFVAVLAKGKGNYVCKLRLEDEAKSAAFEDADPIIEWAMNTETGDLADYPGQPSPIWQNINADDTCIGAKCPLYDECHYYEAKRDAENAHLIICNHHLFFADLQVREMSGGYASVLPDACAVIFDEAHHLEDIARSSLGEKVSDYWIGYWTRQVRRLPMVIADGLYESVAHANDVFFTSIAYAMNDVKGDVPSVDPEKLSNLVAQVNALRKEIARQIDSLSAEDQSRAEKLNDQAAEFLRTVQLAVKGEGENNFVCWAEVEERPSGNKVTLHRTPIDIAGDLKRSLFDAYPSVIMTSATLSIAKSFEHMHSRIGAPHALELIVPSPFEYRAQSLLYVPRPDALPDPQAVDYHEQITPLIERILDVTEGRAFVLFTSYQGMRTVFERLHKRLKYPVLRQGDAPRSTLLEQFRTEKHSILFGTKSFWEGVDVQGEALSCVILDKLPFASPGDPVSKAVADSMERAGKSAFYDLVLPEAIITTKQGFGRLIRSRTDRGVVAILDRRIRSMSYGRMFLASLPPARRVERLNDVAAFMSADKEGVA